MTYSEQKCKWSCLLIPIKSVFHLTSSEKCFFSLSYKQVNSSAHHFCIFSVYSRDWVDNPLGLSKEKETLFFLCVWKYYQQLSLRQNRFSGARIYLTRFSTHSKTRFSSFSSNITLAQFLYPCFSFFLFSLWPSRTANSCWPHCGMTASQAGGDDTGQSNWSPAWSSAFCFLSFHWYERAVEIPPTPVKTEWWNEGQR